MTLYHSLLAYFKTVFSVTSVTEVIKYLLEIPYTIDNVLLVEQLLLLPFKIVLKLCRITVTPLK